MKSKTTLIALASLFLLASCTGKSKKVNENALWKEKPAQTETVAAKVETATESKEEVPQAKVTETKPEQASVSAEKPQEQKTENLEEVDDDKIYEKPDIRAICPLDDREVMEFVTKHFEFPKSFSDKPFNARGTAFLTIEKDGSISNVEIIPSISPDMNKEYIRVTKLFPKFTPAKVKGKPVRSKWSMAVAARAM